MTSRDIIRSEADNVDRIILYREGLFWKAYERSAYAMCTQIRPFKPTKKRLKALDGGEIVSIGFPSASEKGVLDGFETLETEPCRLVVAARRPINVKEFEAWKSTVAINSPKPKAAAAVVASDDDASDVQSSAAEIEVETATETAQTDVPAGVGDPLDVIPVASRYGEADFTLSEACEIAARVKNFNLADSTPMECMFFISELKKLLSNR